MSDRHGTPWTLAEDAVIHQYHEYTTPSLAPLLPGRSMGAIGDRMRKLGYGGPRGTNKRDKSSGPKQRTLDVQRWPDFGTQNLRMKSAAQRCRRAA